LKIQSLDPLSKNQLIKIYFIYIPQHTSTIASTEHSS
jgi:hypothetical protein